MGDGDGEYKNEPNFKKSISIPSVDGIDAKKRLWALGQQSFSYSTSVWVYDNFDLKMSFFAKNF